MPYRAVQYCAVLCRALPCCVLCCVLTIWYTPASFEVSYHVPVLLQHQVCTHCIFLGSISINDPQLSSAHSYIYSSAAQRRAVRCRAVPCLALRCGAAVSCCAVLSSENTAVPGISLLLLLFVVVLTLTRTIKSVVTGQAPVTLELRNTPAKNNHNPRWYTHISQLRQFMPQYHAKHQVTVRTCCVLVFLLSPDDGPLSVLMFPPPRKLHPYCRSEGDMANKHTAQCTAQCNY